MTDKELANLKEASDACGPVSHVEAFDHLLRFKNKAFRCSGGTPILCIPANPRTDSDLRLGAYIYQCWERDPADELARLRAENERLRRALETWHKDDTAPEGATVSTEIDIAKLKAECEEEIRQARREGWKDGYLFANAENPYQAGRLANAWREGRNQGQAARRAEQKVKEPNP